MDENDYGKLVGDGPIVVVDDDIGFHELLVIVHEKSVLTHELVLFSSGFEVLEYLAEVEHGRATLPCIILMDVNMPKMNGIEAVREIRKCTPFKEIPFITMLSSSDHESDKEQSKVAGANGYKRKPLELKEHIEFFNSLAP